MNYLILNFMYAGPKHGLLHSKQRMMTDMVPIGELCLFLL